MPLNCWSQEGPAPVFLGELAGKTGCPTPNKDKKTPKQNGPWGPFPPAPRGFPDSSVGKESICNAGDPGLIPGSGRSAGEGIGYPLQYSWASLVAQLVKNLPTIRKTWVQPLGWQHSLEKGKATHCSILAWRIPWTVQSMGSQSQTLLSDFHFTPSSRRCCSQLAIFLLLNVWTSSFGPASSSRSRKCAPRPKLPKEVSVHP